MQMFENIKNLRDANGIKKKAYWKKINKATEVDWIKKELLLEMEAY